MMLWTIIRKEIVSHILSLRFGVTFILFILLIFASISVTNCEPRFSLRAEAGICIDLVRSLPPPPSSVSVCDIRPSSKPLTTALCARQKWFTIKLEGKDLSEQQVAKVVVLIMHFFDPDLERCLRLYNFILLKPKTRLHFPMGVLGSLLQEDWAQLPLR